jgi:ubiquinone/menaquinone biosynthesis C-methylase UbiE
MQDSFSLAETSFLERLAPGAVVLDLGCGTGRHAHTLSLGLSSTGGFRVCALDEDVDALSTAQSLYSPEERAGRVLFCAGRAQSLPFAAAVFDAVVCIDVLHWSADAAAFDAAWREAWRALRPGGVFCARLRIRDFATASESGWFLADRQRVEDAVAQGGGEWLEPITRDGDSALLIVRKPGPD